MSAVSKTIALAEGLLAYFTEQDAADCERRLTITKAEALAIRQAGEENERLRVALDLAVRDVALHALERGRAEGQRDELLRVLGAAGEAEAGTDNDVEFDAASDALWTLCRRVAGRSEVTGVSELTEAIKDTVTDAHGHRDEVSNTERPVTGAEFLAAMEGTHFDDDVLREMGILHDDEPAQGDEVRRG